MTEAIPSHNLQYSFRGVSSAEAPLDFIVLFYECVRVLREMILTCLQARGGKTGR